MWYELKRVCRKGLKIPKGVISSDNKLNDIQYNGQMRNPSPQWFTKHNTENSKLNKTDPTKTGGVHFAISFFVEIMNSPIETVYFILNVNI